MLLILLFHVCHGIQISVPGWTWLSGSGVGNQHSVLHDHQALGSRSNAASWQDNDGNVWVYGGKGYDNQPTNEARMLSDLWLFNSSTLQWKLINDGKYHNKYPYPRSGACLCGVTNTMLLLFGGLSNKDELYDSWLYDIPKSTWLPMVLHASSHPSARHGSACWCTEDQMVLYSGSSLQDDIWLFSYINMTWQKQSQFVNLIQASSKAFPEPRHSSTTWKIANNLYMYGGQVNNKYFADLWHFSLNTSQWHFDAQDLSVTARSGAGGWVDTQQENLLMFGGCSPSPSNELFSYNLADKQWYLITANASYLFEETVAAAGGFINVAKNPSARCACTTWSNGGQHYLIGGWGKDQRHQMAHLADSYLLLETKAQLPVVRTTHTRHMSAKRVFFIVFASFGGLVLVFGAVFFFKKIVDLPRHHPSRSYNIKYSPLADEAESDM